MHIVIDGYNLYKYIQNFKELSKTEFVTLLARYACIKQHVITVVFDGGEMSWPSTQKVGSITVIQAGWKQTADDYIVEMVYHDTKGIALVVSSDQDLCRQIAEKVVIDSGLFWSCVHAAVDQQKPIVHGKTAPISKKPKKEWTDFDHYMHQAVTSQTIEHKQESISDEAIHQNKTSRIDKRLMEIVKKL